MPLKRNLRNRLLNSVFWVSALSWFGVCALWPILGIQAFLVRRKTPLLPEALGDRTGEAHPEWGNQLRILVLGESPVVGIGVQHAEEALGGQVAQALSEELHSSIFWESIGKSGVTVARARTELGVSHISVHPHLIILAFGVNDSIEFRSPGNWQVDVKELVFDLRVRFGAIPIVIASVPPLTRFPGLPKPLGAILGLRSWILGTVAARISLPNVYYHPMDQSRIEATFFCSDLFHPSTLGYQLWGRDLASFIQPLFSNVTPIR